MTTEALPELKPEAEKDQWRTPPWLFAFLSRRFGPFDVDMAASAANHLCPVYITREENALAQDWGQFEGQTLFCNPPFSAPGPWVSRARHAVLAAVSTVLVLPSHTNQAWAALSQYAAERLDFEGRVNYYRPDGSGEQKGNRGGTQVLYFRAFDFGPPRVCWVKTAEIRKAFEDAPDA